MGDAHQIVPGLWMGSAPPPGTSLPGFTMIVLAAREFQPRSPAYPGISVVHVPLPDGPPLTADQEQRARLAGRMVADEVRRGGKVLVTCWQGINRSGLIVGLALKELGAEGAAALAHIRAKRVVPGWVPLSNPIFARMVAA